MKVASDGTTLLRRYPEIGRAGVEDDLESLRWGADGNFREILRDVS